MLLIRSRVRFSTSKQRNQTVNLSKNASFTLSHHFILFLNDFFLNNVLTNYVHSNFAYIGVFSKTNSFLPAIIFKLVGHKNTF